MPWLFLPGPRSTRRPLELFYFGELGSAWTFELCMNLQGRLSTSTWLGPRLRPSRWLHLTDAVPRTASFPGHAGVSEDKGILFWDLNRQV